MQKSKVNLNNTITLNFILLYKTIIKIIKNNINIQKINIIAIRLLSKLQIAI